MRRVPFCLVLMLLGACDGVDQDTRRIEQIEAKLMMPRGASPIGFYTRRYSWADQNHRMVRGVFQRGGDGNARWVSRDKAVMILDGGCDVVILTFDASANRVRSIGCNGGA